ncbi:MAG: DnaK suppressor protein [Polyangiales bacterium]|jgi:DnaK suppressor protein
MEPGELGEEELHAFRDALLALEASLLVSLEHVEDEAVELDQTRMGRLSRIDAIQQQQMSAAGRRGQELRLSQVRSALERMTRDEYGACVSCEEPIAQRRLNARPEAPLCLLCQSRRE